MALRLIWNHNGNPELDGYGTFYDDYNDVVYVFGIDGEGNPLFYSNYMSNQDLLHIGQASNYDYCKGTSLIQFFGISEFPYAQRVLVEGAAKCAIPSPPCDLTIIGVQTTLPNKAGASDGSVKIIATSSNTPVRYTISLPDSSEYLPLQTSNTFNGLLSGNYTFEVYDNGNCYTSGSFTIQSVPEFIYGTRYTVTYKDLEEVNKQVRIKQKGYAGIMEEISARQAVVRFAKSFNEESRFAPIAGSKCDVNLIADIDFQYIDLFTSDEREYLIEHLIEGEINWRGYLLPDQYREGYTAAPYDVVLMATDGLGTLSDLPFEMDNGNPVKGSMSQLQVIVFILNKLDLDLPIYTSINTFELSMKKGPDDDPLVQAMVNTEVYKGMSCFEVLSEILEPYGARILQEKGAFHIIEINPIQNDQNPIYFDLKDAKNENGNGKATIYNVSGGSELDGDYEASIDGVTWYLLSTLTALGNGEYQFQNIAPGTHTMYVRRTLNDDNVATRVFTIPEDVVVYALIQYRNSGISGDGNRQFGDVWVIFQNQEGDPIAVSNVVVNYIVDYNDNGTEGSGPGSTPPITGSEYNIASDVTFSETQFDQGGNQTYFYFASYSLLAGEGYTIL